MHVAENMVGAVAVIARAAGAVTELQFRMIRIGSAADAALMMIAPLRLLLHMALRFSGAAAILLCLRRMAITLPLHTALEVGGKEHKEVQQCHHGHQRLHNVTCQQARHHTEGKHRRIHIRQPLDLDGDDVEQQYLHLGIEHGEGKEHGHIHIRRAAEHRAAAKENLTHDRCEHRQHHAADVVNGEAPRTPVLLQCIANEIIEVQGDQQEKGVTLGGNKDKGQHAPDLAVEHPLRIQPQKRRGSAAGEHGQQIDHHRAAHNIKHQIGNAEGRVHGAPAVDPIIPSFE